MGRPLVLFFSILRGFHSLTLYMRTRPSLTLKDHDDLY